MSKNEVSDPITDQEIAFALLVLAGAMTDRRAAEAVGLNPDSAAYTKAKPRVRTFMLEHRAAVQQQLLQQDADLSRLPRRAVGRAVEELRPVGPDREQVLARLWELAHLSPEVTRNSITGQIKAISMIVAMQNFIPDRRAASARKISTPAPTQPQIDAAAWRAGQQATTHATTNDPQPTPAPDQEEAQPEDAPGSAAEAPPDPGPSQPTPANCLTPSKEPRWPYPPLFNSVPDLGVYFPMPKNPFVDPR